MNSQERCTAVWNHEDVRPFTGEVYILKHFRSISDWKYTYRVRRQSQFAERKNRRLWHGSVLQFADWTCNPFGTTEVPRMTTVDSLSRLSAANHPFPIKVDRSGGCQCYQHFQPPFSFSDGPMVMQIDSRARGSSAVTVLGDGLCFWHHTYVTLQCEPKHSSFRLCACSMTHTQYFEIFFWRRE